MKEKFITLTEAVDKVGKVFGKKNYRSVKVEITDDGDGEKTIVWQIYSSKRTILVSGNTFNNAFKELRKALHPQKEKVQDVSIKEKI